DGSVGARRLGVAEAGEGAGETERREGVGAAHRIVGVDRVERQRVDAAGGQGAIRLVADAYERLRVIRLAGAAGVGARALQEQRPAVLVHLRLLSRGGEPVIRVESPFKGTDKRPAAARQERKWLAHLDAGDRLAEIVRRPK